MSQAPQGDHRRGLRRRLRLLHGLAQRTLALHRARLRSRSGGRGSVAAKGRGFALCSADDPPFEKGRFDAVYAGEIIEHLPEPHHALRRWVELLKPNGRLIVTTPNRRHLWTQVRGFELVENPEHLFEWDLRQLRRAVVAAGAQVDAVEGLIQQLPVWIPGRGWRDLTPALVHRVSHTPGWFVRP